MHTVRIELTHFLHRGVLGRSWRRSERPLRDFAARTSRDRSTPSRTQKREGRDPRRPTDADEALTNLRRLTDLDADILTAHDIDQWRDVSDAAAEHSTADEFARSVRDEARRLEADGDGLGRLERQRRAVRCNRWTDKETGMGAGRCPGTRRLGWRWRADLTERSKQCSTTPTPRVARRICGRSNRSCVPTHYSHCAMATGPEPGRRRSESAAGVRSSPPEEPHRRLARRARTNRELTITLPDGQIVATGPPKRGAA